MKTFFLFIILTFCVCSCQKPPGKCVGKLKEMGVVGVCAEATNEQICMQIDAKIADLKSQRNKVKLLISKETNNAAIWQFKNDYLQDARASVRSIDNLARTKEDLDSTIKALEAERCRFLD